MPPVYDQGQLGSCTANAIGGAIDYQRRQEKQTPFVPSRLFIYYQERVIEGTVKQDAGAEIRDGMKAVHNLGAPDEKLWPYRISKFTTKPSLTAYKAALKDIVSSYSRVNQVIGTIKGALAQKKPVVFGFTVYDGFESDVVSKTGVLNMPQPGEQVLGGHAVLAVGYDDYKKRVLVRNSWGADWGIAGYFTMPYAYILDSDLSSDFWVVNTVT
jgi:C1A family cysteine protease